MFARNLLVVFPCEVAEHVLVALLAGSQGRGDHKLYGILAHPHPSYSIEVEALLIGQPGYDTDHHRLRIDLES